MGTLRKTVRGVSAYAHVCLPTALTCPTCPFLAGTRHKSPTPSWTWSGVTDLVKFSKVWSHTGGGGGSGRWPLLPLFPPLLCCVLVLAAVPAPVVFADSRPE